MKVLELFGHHISYSASPVIHRAALRVLGLESEYDYVLTDVSPAHFPREIERFRESGVGANVTVPHKRMAAEACDELTDDARMTRAVNTIVRTGTRLTGHNTDIPALADEIRALSPDGVRRAVVLGNGGASKAVQLALFRMDAAVTVAQRRDGSLRNVGALLRSADLLVNATPVGTLSDESPIDPEDLRPEVAVLDLVYRPTPTTLVEDARAIGARARNGGGLLVGQAWRSLALWLAPEGITVGPEIADPMLAALLDELGAESV
ncbi:MAG: shikimate dehydrogenase [Actinomycetales bacterium]|nr:shikimate dehydrogenase [Actinomycetales bacterium]